jgi:hypothetical protein
LGTGSWKSQHSSSSGVPESRNVKRRNPEEGGRFWIPGVGDVKNSYYRSLKSRSREMRDCEMSKTPYRRFGYQELEESSDETLHRKNHERPKCEMPK